MTCVMPPEINQPRLNLVQLIKKVLDDGHYGKHVAWVGKQGAASSKGK